MRSRIASSSALAGSALAGAVVMALATPALGEPTATERAMADSLFRDAKRLLTRGKTPEACEKLQASYHLDPAGGTLMNLAMCHEIEGKTATAWTEFSVALAAAKKAARGDREKAAREHLGALEPRLSHVTVTVPPSSAAPDLAVTLDGTAIESNALGTPIAVDPGEHTTAAKASGKTPWETKVTLREAESRTLTVPPLASTSLPPPPPPPPLAWKRPVGLAALGAGVVLLGVGTGFGVHAISLGSQAGNQCPAELCSPAGLTAVSDGRAAAAVANGTLAAGAVLSAGGAVLLILSALAAPEAKTTGSARFEVSPSLGKDLWLLAGGGAF